MAQEGTLGLARAGDTPGEDLSKEDLQRRMDEARESISQTVTEIKDSVVHQYETVKETISETLDWREQFKKRPVAWTAGAVSAGFLTGYCLTSMVKGEGHGYDRYDEGYQQARLDHQASQTPYAERPPQATVFAAQTAAAETDAGPGLLSRIQETPAYGRVKHEASNLGGRFVDEVSKTAQDVLLPAAIGWVRHWLEGLIPERKQPALTQSALSYGREPSSGASLKSVGTSGERSGYQPAREPGDF